MICRTEGVFWDESAEKRAFGPLFIWLIGFRIDVNVKGNFAYCCDPER